MQAREDVEAAAELAAVDHVEDLAPNEHIEDQCTVMRD